MLAATVVALLALAPAHPAQLSYVAADFPRYTIMLADEHGRNPVELTAGKPAFRLGNTYSWSPDGSELVYPDADGNLDVLSADGSMLTRVATGDAAAPTWSPDGRWIAFSRDHATWLVAPDGTGERRLASGGAANWSPDGRQVAVGGTIIDVASGRALLQTAGDEVLWSPDDTHILISSGSNIDVAATDGSDRRTVARNGAFDGSWSPDGTQIVFGRDRCLSYFRGSCAVRRAWISVVGVDGGPERTLTAATDLGDQPVWWPDGRQLFYERSGGGGTYVMNADGTCEHPFVASGTYRFQEQWRPGSEPSTPPLDCFDLRVSVAVDHTDLGLLEPERLDVAVENDGNETATGARLELRFNPDAARMRPPMSSCTSSGPTLGCDLDPLPPGAQRAFRIDIVQRHPRIVYTGATVVSTDGDSDPRSNTSFTVFKIWPYDVVGTIAADRITVRPTVRSVWARAGTDFVDARDGRRETIDCGAGNDTVVADRVDRLRNCEIVRYR